jgi:hypothetical protein
MGQWTHAAERRKLTTPIPTTAFGCSVLAAKVWFSYLSVAALGTFLTLSYKQIGTKQPFSAHLFVLDSI